MPQVAEIMAMLHMEGEGTLMKVLLICLIPQMTHPGRQHDPLSLYAGLEPGRHWNWNLWRGV